MCVYNYYNTNKILGKEQRWRKQLAHRCNFSNCRVQRNLRSLSLARYQKIDNASLLKSNVQKSKCIARQEVIDARSFESIRWSARAA